MRVTIVGAGAIGMLLTYYLTKNGFETTLLTNSQRQASELMKQDLQIIKHDQTRDQIKVDARPLRTLVGGETIDLMILAVKSYDIENVLTYISELKLSITSILFLQNGMGHIDLVSGLSIQEIGIGIVEHGALRKNDFTVHHTGLGQIKWGYYLEGRGMVRKIQTSASFPFIEDENWYSLLEKKWIVNLCVNPMTAAFNLKNGELLLEHYQKMVRIIFEEVILVLDRQDERDELWKYLQQVCHNTAENYSSMYIDLEMNRKTEIEGIVGALKKRATRLNRSVPVINFLYEGIKARECHRG
ncbi:2-dehydropantoate 2-reductase [Bacillus suaedae]|uniref:2-dehydropantoate 2-reductase n=1 Tax=Halalkalibacter suaedae TaxID=2822140 RepID=A0A941AQ21_9BACI|nr:2-dehydropantoate 2-reductase [Bacillus suaedae]MBP3952137.1 2-dehydropantoate 2-reductase [Bacillus suaedae]